MGIDGVLEGEYRAGSVKYGEEVEKAVGCEV
jgi:hypothetical protein